MANKEHLKILKQGVEAWNQWREKNSKITPDLSDAHLSGANLAGANLSGANLKETTLDGAILAGAIYDKKTMFPDTLNQEKLDKMEMILSKKS